MMMMMMMIIKKKKNNNRQGSSHEDLPEGAEEQANQQVVPSPPAYGIPRSHYTPPPAHLPRHAQVLSEITTDVKYLPREAISLVYLLCFHQINKVTLPGDTRLHTLIKLYRNCVLLGDLTRGLLPC